jgi:hypothetical protein
MAAALCRSRKSLSAQVEIVARKPWGTISLPLFLSSEKLGASLLAQSVIQVTDGRAAMRVLQAGPAISRRWAQIRAGLAYDRALLGPQVGRPIPRRGGSERRALATMPPTQTIMNSAPSISVATST